MSDAVTTANDQAHPLPATATVGFVGLGRMGAPIAANVAGAGHPLIVWNRDATKSARFAAAVACTVASDVATLAAESDIIISMVADGEALAQIFLDERVLEAMRGKRLVDMSTIGPTFAVDFAARLRVHDVHFVESPVSGSTAAATAATLTLLVGAEPEDFTVVAPVLRPLGRELLHLGPPGSASLVKVAINSLVLGINQCVSEALVLAERGGLDRTAAYDAFLSSAAASPVMQYRREHFLDPEGAEVSFTVELAEKDLGLATDLARLHGLATPQADANRSAARDAIAAGYGQADVSAIAEHLRSAGR